MKLVSYLNRFFPEKGGTTGKECWIYTPKTKRHLGLSHHGEGGLLQPFLVRVKGTGNPGDQDDDCKTAICEEVKHRETSHRLSQRVFVCL